MPTGVLNATTTAATPFHHQSGPTALAHLTIRPHATGDEIDTERDQRRRCSNHGRFAIESRRPQATRRDRLTPRKIPKFRNLDVKSRYPCSGLAPVAVFQCPEGFQAALIREGRPPALANAPFSRERS
jgi:hypothetical protein